ncbi:MAG: M20 family metallopeptidase [Saprospiraceae bacterium]
MLSTDKIKLFLKEKESELLQIRHHLHAHPELSFQEQKTSEYIQSLLDSWGVKYTSGWAGYGIVGQLSGKKDNNKVVALRADMDALPIVEASGFEFSSLNHGVMHACGHDVHMSCLLGAICVLNHYKEDWDGTIKFIFQPGEEKLPGGASILIQEKVLENPFPKVIIGQHVQPNMPVGNVGICEGQAMASCDEIYITIHGKGGHAAMPHLSINPIGIGAELILKLNDLLLLEKPDNIKSLLSFGKFNTIGGATNIIPETIKIEGTFRCMNEEFRLYFQNRMKTISQELAGTHQAIIDFNIDHGYPCLINDSYYTKEFVEIAKNFVGEESVQILEPRMTSEDFAYYSQLVPAVFYRLGTGASSNVHSPQFIVNEESIVIGSGLMASLALHFLANT